MVLPPVVLKSVNSQCTLHAMPGWRYFLISLFARTIIEFLQIIPKRIVYSLLIHWVKRYVKIIQILLETELFEI